MIKVKNEHLFRRFAHTECLTTERGREQFFRDQSKGVKPEAPDDYYTALTLGKRAFDLLSSEYHKMYVLNEWWGFLQLWKDWEGERWILPHLCSWYPSVANIPLPSWLDAEISEEELSEVYDVGRISERLLDITREIGQALIEEKE